MACFNASVRAAVTIGSSPFCFRSTRPSGSVNRRPNIPNGGCQSLANRASAGRGFRARVTVGHKVGGKCQLAVYRYCIEKDIGCQRLFGTGPFDPALYHLFPVRQAVTAPGVLGHHASLAIGNAYLVQDIGNVRRRPRRTTHLPCRPARPPRRRGHCPDPHSRDYRPDRPSPTQELHTGTARDTLTADNHAVYGEARCSRGQEYGSRRR